MRDELFRMGAVKFPNGNKAVSIWKFGTAFFMFSWQAATIHTKINILN
jgi:hypothetical protein